MKQLQASCTVQGTLTIPSSYSLHNGFSTTGNLADYTFKTPESLQKTANSYSLIERNGKTIKGASYTLKMAQNDFDKYAK